MDTAVGFNVLAGAALAVTSVIYILDAFVFSMIHYNSLMVRHVGLMLNLSNIITSHA